RLLRPGPIALALAATVAVPAATPATAGTPGVGAATVPGLSTNFTLVGHTDLQQRGMNSPLAVAGNCAYVGDRYYSSSPDAATRPNGGIAIIDVSNPATPTQTGIIPPIELST